VRTGEIVGVAMTKRRVFLSYCREDLAAVEQLHTDLVKGGFAVWWDRDILPGHDWEFEIRKALAESDAFVVCFSKNTQARYKTGIFPELSQAIKVFRQMPPGSTFIFPVRLSECEIPSVEIDATRD
jgi:hypothetical protein